VVLVWPQLRRLQANSPLVLRQSVWAGSRWCVIGYDFTGQPGQGLSAFQGPVGVCRGRGCPGLHVMPEWYGETRFFAGVRHAHRLRCTFCAKQGVDCSGGSSDSCNNESIRLPERKPHGQQRHSPWLSSVRNREKAFRSRWSAWLREWWRGETLGEFRYVTTSSPTQGVLR